MYMFEYLIYKVRVVGAMVRHHSPQVNIHLIVTINVFSGATLGNEWFSNGREYLTATLNRHRHQRHFAPTCEVE